MGEWELPVSQQKSSAEVCVLVCCSWCLIIRLFLCEVITSWEEKVKRTNRQLCVSQVCGVCRVGFKHCINIVWRYGQIDTQIWIWKRLDGNIVNNFTGDSPQLQSCMQKKPNWWKIHILWMIVLIFKPKLKIENKTSPESMLRKVALCYLARAYVWSQLW